MREQNDAPDDSTNDTPDDSTDDATDGAPEDCPVCSRAYDSMLEHDAGVMVTLRDNERYRRVCFEPRTDGRLWFFHHTHAQTRSNGDAPRRMRPSMR